MSDALSPEEVNARLMEFRLDFERRHGELSQRVAGGDGILSERLTRLEISVSNLATHDDLSKLKNEIIAELSKMVATTTDVGWLKKAYWVLVTAIVGVMVSSGIAVFLHYAGKIP